ncbi:3'(2'),5'-bisphosphate nucleotidase [Sarracenia purpurea var. burkii]
MAGTTVVVFDFDHTIIEDNSDTWVVAEMGLTDLFNQLRRKLPWTSLMDRMMAELHSQGKTIEEISVCLRRIHMNPRIIAAIRKAHSRPKCELKIISDANQFFIETILKHYGLFDCFSEIITNPSIVEGEGQLRIFPYHDSLSSPHGCNLCPPNLCKGLVIEEIQASNSEMGKKRMIYLGDGRGDFCPSLKLGEGDHVMPRKGFPLWERIGANPMLIKAEVHEWSKGEELERILIQLIDTNSNEGNSET